MNTITEKKRKEAIFNLMDSTLSVIDITCSKCKQVGQVVNMDEYESAECFYNSGWRTNKVNDPICPKCRKKKAKKK